MKKRKKQLCNLSTHGLTGSKTLSLIDKDIQKLKSISSLIRKHIHRPPQSITDRMLYNSPFIIAESYGDITEEEIEYLENELRTYKESIKDK